MEESFTLPVANTVSLETILLFNIDVIVGEYEEKIHIHLMKQNRAEVKKLLTDFCRLLLDLIEEDQAFIARIFFTSIITTILHIQNKKSQLHPKVLTKAYQLIYHMEQFHNISEFILFIPTFTQKIQQQFLHLHETYEYNHYVNRALQLIHEHICERYVSLSWLAQKLNISTTHLSSLFKRHTGQTVHQYIIEKTMEEVAFDLRYTNAPIHVIREKYGYENSSHFIRLFKRVKGVTPLQYQQARFM